jgi:hypothetical protein
MFGQCPSVAIILLPLWFSAAAGSRELIEDRLACTGVTMVLLRKLTQMASAKLGGL